MNHGKCEMDTGYFYCQKNVQIFLSGAFSLTRGVGLSIFESIMSNEIKYYLKYNELSA